MAETAHPTYNPPPPDEDEQPERRPPADGTTGTCGRCGNEIRYNGGKGRWEHVGKGSAACFGK